PTDAKEKNPPLTHGLTTLILNLLGKKHVVLCLLGFRTNAFSVYILNLAGADFLLLCFLMIESLNKLIKVFHYPFFIPNVFHIVLTFSYLAGLYMLSTTSTERCLSVLWPIWYRCHPPRHTSAVVCGLLWALALLLCTLDLLCQFWDIGDDIWCRTSRIIIKACLALLVRFLCGSQQMRITRLYVTYTVLVFLVCGLPSGIVRFSYFWMKLDNEVLCYLFLVSVFLTSVNSSANPIIYFFGGSFRQRWQEGQQTLQQVLQRALQDTPEVDERGGSLPQGSLELLESR
uniref:Mas-related G-protein coupled receptor member X2 n=1 Tax=Propithecus coquereli TaxID=379532 RepID=A0A2K6FFA2_PROCO